MENALDLVNDYWAKSSFARPVLPTQKKPRKSSRKKLITKANLRKPGQKRGRPPKTRINRQPSSSASPPPEAETSPPSNARQLPEDTQSTPQHSNHMENAAPSNQATKESCTPPTTAVSVYTMLLGHHKKETTSTPSTSPKQPATPADTLSNEPEPLADKPPQQPDSVSSSPPPCIVRPHISSSTSTSHSMKGTSSAHHQQQSLPQSRGLVIPYRAPLDYPGSFYVRRFSPTAQHAIRSISYQRPPASETLQHPDNQKQKSLTTLPPSPQSQQPHKQPQFRPITGALTTRPPPRNHVLLSRPISTPRPLANSPNAAHGKVIYLSQPPQQWSTTLTVPRSVYDALAAPSLQPSMFQRPTYCSSVAAPSVTHFFPSQSPLSSTTQSVAPYPTIPRSSLQARSSSIPRPKTPTPPPHNPSPTASCPSPPSPVSRASSTSSSTTPQLSRTLRSTPSVPPDEVLFSFVPGLASTDENLKMNGRMLVHPYPRRNHRIPTVIPPLLDNHNQNEPTMTEEGYSWKPAQHVPQKRDLRGNTRDSTDTPDFPLFDGSTPTNEDFRKDWNWECDVIEVVSAVAIGDKPLIYYSVRWNDRVISTHQGEVVRDRCPKQLLAFMERHMSAPK
ncbi:hypothetical protein DM01DRAFT_164126 [Hesseltinella vesiculosa]|uniref:Chromo shadow domain-containing protein n=1 Tax=Hesseltinella vesiculosa TaxID=101127 RepID=A0A1X2GNR2_9FUNG|nr:hypothetical protein DM01DRAFT_164126 [Hesseltinella vesiculosa]